MYKMHRLGKVGIAALTLALVLSACGGSDDDDSSTSSSASSSVASSAASSESSSAASSEASSESSSEASATQSISWTPATAGLITAGLTDDTTVATLTSGGNISLNASADGGTEVDDLVYLYNKSTGNLRLYEDSDGGYAINYNGSSFTASAAVAVDDTIDLTSTSQSRYVKIPYTATASSVTFTMTWANSTSGTYADGYITSSGKEYGAGQIVLTDADGKVLYVQSADPIVDGEAVSTQQTLTTTFTDASASNTALYVLFTRVTDGTGGIRIWNVSLSSN